MNNIITFGGVSSSDYGIFAPGLLRYETPRRKMQTYEIPGRNGSLIIDENTFENTEVTASMIIPFNYLENYSDYIAAINSVGGYQVLEESERSDRFWYGCLHSAIDPEHCKDYSGGKYDVIWDCKPQRWLKIGLVIQSFSQSGTISNPTRFDAKPNIRVFGYGQIVIGNVTMTIGEHSFEYVDVDCEAMAAFNGATNCNGLLSVSSDAFPTLRPGTNGIRISGNIASIQIQPRWWTL